MANEVDTLEVKVEAQARGANSQLDKLVRNLQSVNASLGGIQSGGLISLANGVSMLGSAMQTMSNIKATDFNRIATGIKRLGDINPATLEYAASSLNSFVNSMNSISTVSSNAQSVGDLAKSISKLGNKGVTAAIQNIPTLSSALKQMMQVLSGAPAVSENVIQMTSAMASLASNGSKVASTTKNLSTGFKQYTESTRKATSGSRSLAYYIGKLYANYFMLIRSVKGVGSAIKSSMDYIEEYNYFNVVTGKVASEWGKDYEKYGYDNAESYENSFRDRLTGLMSKMSGYQINSDGTLTDLQSNNLGLDITGLTNYSAGLMQVTNSLGLTGEASVATSKALTMLAGDMSSFRNTPLSEVMANMQSGLIGQSRALYKYGIDITNATLANYALANGVTKAISEMSQSEKMQLRMIAILDQSKVAYGDLANTINSPSNQLRMLQNNFTALARTIGNLFLPVVAKVLPYVNGLVIAIRRLFTWVGSLLGVDLSGIIDNSGAGYTDAFDSIEDDADDASDAIDGTTDSAKELENQLMGFDEINKLSDTSDSSSGSSGSSSGSGDTIDLTDALNAALADYESVWNDAFSGMTNTANQYADDICDFFSGIAKYAEPSVVAVKNLWNDGLSKFNEFSFNNAKNFLDSFLIPLGKWTLGKGFPDLVNATNDFLVEINWTRLTSNLNSFYKSIEPFAEGVGNGLIKFYKGITAIGANVINLVGDAIGGFAKVLNAIGANKIESIGEAFGVLLGALLTYKALSSVIGTISKVSDAFVGSKGLITLMAKHPTTAIVAGIIALTAAIVGFTGGVKSKQVEVATAALVGLATGIAVFKTVQSIPKIIDTFKSSASILVTFLTGNPVLLAASALAGLVVAITALSTEANNNTAMAQYAENAKVQADKIKTECDKIDQSLENTKNMLSDADSDANTLQTLADKYFELADKTSLTNGEQETLLSLADQLVEKCPELAGKIDITTGAYNDTKDAIQDVIDKTKESYKVQALQEQYTQYIQEQFSAQQELKEAEQERAEFDEKLAKAQKDYANASAEYNKLSYSEMKNSNNAVVKQLYAARNALDKLKSTESEVQSAVDTAQGKVDKATTYMDDCWSAMTTDMQKSNDSARVSAQNAFSAIEQSVKTSTKNSESDVTAFFNSASTTFSRLGSVGTNGGNSLSTCFGSAISGMPLFSQGIYEQINGVVSSVASGAGTNSGSNLVDAYKNSITGIPNATAVQFLSIIDSVNSGKIGADEGTELMDNLIASIGTKKQAVHDALVNALSGSYQASLSGDTNYSVGDPMSSGFMTRLSFQADGGLLDRGQMFVAREKGPELVGNMGSHTAVANNDQIAEGFASAIYPAMFNAVSQAMSNSGGSGTPNIEVYVDGEKVTGSVVKRINNTTRATGVSPILT